MAPLFLVSPLPREKEIPLPLPGVNKKSLRENTIVLASLFTEVTPGDPKFTMAYSPVHVEPGDSHRMYLEALFIILRPTRL